MGSSHLVAGRYRLDEPLGEGGMGMVWRGTDTELGREVALKRSQIGDHGQIRREARVGAGLLHPNVITVFDTVTEGVERWLVMEYLPSRSLEQILETGKPLAEPDVVKIGAQLASALTAMHVRGIVHRDIKPGNILVTDDGVAKLTDLGIARWAEVTRTGGAQIAGTLGYLAPEVADGQEATAAADVFSLGASLFAAVEGQSPWGAGEDGPFVQMRRAAACELEPMRRADVLAPILETLLSRNPADRPTAADVHALLLGDMDPSELTPRRARVSRRSRHGLLIGTAAASVAALVTVVVTATSDPGGQAANTLGDNPKSADPCAALPTNTFISRGEPFLDPEVLNFGSCVMTTTLSDGTGQVQTTLDLVAPAEYQFRPTGPGEIGEVQRPSAQGNACVRREALADLNQVVVTSKPLDNAKEPDDLLCNMSESVLTDLNRALVNGPFPQRTVPFETGSLALVDACGLLSGQDISAVLSTPGGPVADFGGWGCTWHKGPKKIDLVFSREWPIEEDTDVEGERTRIGNRPAVVDPASDGGKADKCTVKIVHRVYTPRLPVLKGTPQTREEVVNLDIEDTSTTDTATLCRTATSLAASVVNRLP
jgi:serine/threonine protein kinase